MTKQNDSLLARRKFIKLAGTGMVLAPLATIAGCSGGDDGKTASAPAPAPKAEPKPAPPKPAPPAAAPAPTQTASASNMPKVSEDDAIAKTLGYKHDAADVDTGKFPKRGTPEAANQYCKNCILFQGGDAEWGGCSLFGGKQVKATGWCASWAPRAS